MDPRERAEPIVEGSPMLAVPDEDREAVADLLAEILTAASLERQSGAGAP